MNMNFTTPDIAIENPRTSGRIARQSIARVFAMPAIIAVLSIGGLISGLVGNGIADWVAWLLLSCPLVVVIRAVRTKS